MSKGQSDWLLMTSFAAVSALFLAFCTLFYTDERLDALENPMEARTQAILSLRSVAPELFEEVCQ